MKICLTSKSTTNTCTLSHILLQVNIQSNYILPKWIKLLTIMRKTKQIWQNAVHFTLVAVLLCQLIMKTNWLKLYVHCCTQIKVKPRTCLVLNVAHVFDLLLVFLWMEERVFLCSIKRTPCPYHGNKGKMPGWRSERSPQKPALWSSFWDFYK